MRQRLALDDLRRTPLNLLPRRDDERVHSLLDGSDRRGEARGETDWPPWIDNRPLSIKGPDPAAYPGGGCCYPNGLIGC